MEVSATPLNRGCVREFGFVISESSQTENLSTSLKLPLSGEPTILFQMWIRQDRLECFPRGDDVGADRIAHRRSF